jgi:RecA/RadA recombinase
MVNKKDSDYLSKITKEFGNIISTGEEILKQKKDYKVISISPAIDIALGGGVKEGSWLTLTGDPKSGKAGSMDSIVYTVSGPKKMRDIKPGHEVVTPSGGKAFVLDIFPQGVIDTYQVIFDDGSFTECSGDHLWKVRKNYHGRYTDWQVFSLDEIMSEGLRYSDRPKWVIPLTKPVSFNSTEQKIDPWILGALIGDGGLTNGSPIITTADQEIVDRFLAFAKTLNLELKLKSNSSYDYAISKNGNNAGDNELTNRLRELGLMGVNSKNKFIPKQYKYGDIQQRLELIRGLMDTDGYNDKGVIAEYTTVSKRLCEDFVEVIRSLGYKAKYKLRSTKLNGKDFPSYRVQISGNNVNDIFSLKRKIYHRKRIKPKLVKKIVDVKYIGKKECQCILIDCDEHLYLTDSFNVTHNTTTSMQIIANCQKEDRPIIYLDVEGRLKDMNFEVDDIDPSKMHIIHSDDEPLPAEEFLDVAYRLMSHPDYYRGVLVIDSVSSLMPAKELDGDMTPGRAGLPKILSVFTKKVGQLLPRQRGLIIAITHFISNTAGFGASKMADGGNKIQYQADTRMEIKSGGEKISAVTPWLNSNKERIGQIVNWKILCSSMGPPGGQVQSWIRYGKGIDKTQEVLMLAMDLGMIDKAGAWMTCSFMTEYPDLAKKIKPELNTEDTEAVLKAFKFQGQDNLYDFFSSNEEIVKILEQKIKEML